MIKGGPKIINDGLVLCLDAHDAKSYAGEPADNLNSDTNDYTGTSYSNLGEWTSSPTRLAKSYDSTIKTPIGTGATLIQESGTAGYHHLSRMGGSETGNHTISFYFKPVTNDISDLRICMLGDGSTYIKFDFTQSTPTVTQGGAALSGKLATLESLSDGWYFCAADFNGRSGGWVGSVGYSPQSSYTGTSGNKKAYICGLNYNTLAYAVPSFDRSATNGWVDRSGNSNSGTLTNMIGTEVTHYRDGQVIMPVANSYLDFDGSDDHVKIDHSTQLNNAKTWEIWINIDSFPASSTYDSIFSKTANWNNFGGILLSMIYGHLRFSYGGYWADVSIEQLSNMSTNTWYQVVGTGQFLGSGSGVLMKGYLNGVYKNSLTRTEAFVPTNTNALYLGDGNGGTMNGKIGLFRVYEDILTAAEILSNYNATKGRFS